MSALPAILEMSAIQDLQHGDNITETPDNEYGWKSVLTTVIRYNNTKYTFKMEATEAGIAARVDLLKKQIRRVGNGETGMAQDARRAQRQISTRRPTEKGLLKIQEEFRQSGDLFYL